MSVDRHAVENFLYREARFADENRYEEWLEMWADKCLYWVPSNKDDIDPTREVSIIYEDRTKIEDRIYVLKSGSRWAQEPRSRMRRVIGNVEIEEEATEGGPEIVVYSNYNLIELRRSRQRTFAAHQIHKLVPEGDGFKMTYKKVMLVNSDERLDNLTFLL